MTQSITSASSQPIALNRPAAAGINAAAASSGVAAAPAPANGPAPFAAIAPNPRLSFDQATGLAVIEFRGRTGETESLPTPRELSAYKRAVLSGGEVPVGMKAPQSLSRSVGD